MRQIRFKVYVLKNGVRAGEIQFAEPPTIVCDASAEIQVSMSGVFRDSDLVDYINDELQPVVIIDGAEAPAGVFRAGSVRTVMDHGVRLQQVEAYDRNMWLSWHKVEERAYYAAGSSYSTIIGQLLTSAGITLYSMSPTTATLQSDREWDIGTSYLQIVNDLLDDLAYNHIWFDGRGFGIMQAYQTPTVNAIQHRYGRGEYRQIGVEISSELDVFSRPNVFIVVRSSPDYSSALTATAVNDNPLSSLSVSRRGIRIPFVQKVNNIADQASLQAYADRLRDQNMEGSETVQIQTAIQPDHGVGDIVAVEATELMGVYREVGWSFSMAAGEWMSHTLERTVL